MTAGAISILPLIPKPPNRHNICYTYLGKLIAQARYSDGYSIFVYVLVNSPNLVNQLLLGYNLIFVYRKIIEYLKLLCGKRYNFFLVLCLEPFGRTVKSP